MFAAVAGVWFNARAKVANKVGPELGATVVARAAVSFEIEMATGAAVRTYNILLGERRRIAALLIAVP